MAHVWVVEVRYRQVDGSWSRWDAIDMRSTRCEALRQCRESNGYDPQSAQYRVRRYDRREP